jgi:hypothetical protein
VFLSEISALVAYDIMRLLARPAQALDLAAVAKGSRVPEGSALENALFLRASPPLGPSIALHMQLNKKCFIMYVRTNVRTYIHA